MLTLLSLLLLAPFGILARPTSFSLGQLVFQFPSSPVVENDDTPPPPFDIETASSSTPAIKMVHQFDKMRLENLHARSNGKLILSVINEPVLYSLDPSKSGQNATLLHQFSGVTAMLGQAEIAPDVFAVVGGNWTSPGSHTPGSFSVFSIDLNTQNPTVKKIAAMPEANALNGLTTLHGGSPDIVMIADSTLGCLWRLNVTSGAYDMAFSSPLFTNGTNSPIGINGIRSFQGAIYFFNSGQGTYGRVPVTYDGSWAGEVQIIARIDTPAVWDDFDMDWEGNAWVATHQDMLMEVTVEGKMRNFTGDGSFAMANPTSGRFGRGSPEQENTLYLSAAGNQNVAGQVIAVKTWLI